MNQIAAGSTSDVSRPPAEGEGGLFTQSWFPICLSGDVAVGAVKGYDFLDGRVIVFRDSTGRAHVMSAYCPHLGADLSFGGIVVDDTVRCPFHYFRYDKTGRCVATGAGDPPPPTARLFNYPTAERFGVVFAFNGEKPLFDLPAMPKPDAKLKYKVGVYEQVMPVDPWVICCNTPDMQHIMAVHGITFDGGPPHDKVKFTDYSMSYDFNGVHRGGEPISFRVAIHGSNIYYQEGELGGRWFGFLAPMGLTRPRNAPLYLIVAVEDDPADPAGTQKFLDDMYALEGHVAAEDLPIVANAHFGARHLTRSDKSLARFLKYLSDYPRAHPSAPCIR